jgi:hypothetical protein
MVMRLARVLEGKKQGGVFRRSVVACSLLLLSAFSTASESPSAFSLRGFGTLGMARTTSDQLEFVRDLSQPSGIKKHWDGRGDSVLGLQGAWQIDPRLSAVVQATTKYRYDRTYNPEIAWAYLRYEPTPSTTLRAGRLGTDFFMMADSRWVGYSYLTVRPPGDYFWYLPFYSINGGDVAYALSVGESLVRFKAFYGLSNGQIPLADKQWDINGSPMTGASIEYQFASWQVRASYANITFKHNLPIGDLLQAYSPDPAASASYLSTQNRRSDYYSVGVVYDQGPLQVQLMLNYIEQGSNTFESSEGGYVLAGYRVGEVKPYLGYSWIRSVQRNTAGRQFIESKIMADAHADQNTRIVGMRWDVARNMALKAQWDAIRGEATSIFPYRNDPASGLWPGRMDVYTVTFDFIF